MPLRIKRDLPSDTTFPFKTKLTDSKNNNNNKQQP